MRPLTVAQAEVLGALSTLPAALVAIGDALGLVPATPVVAPHAVPPFANSAMDGFAVRAADVNPAPVDLSVLEDVPAGRVATHRLIEGTAIKIMTGAPIPEGADAVVRVEDTRQSGDTVTINVGVAQGTSVRPAGGDVEAGTQVITTGIRLTPAHIGVLANLGIAELAVHRRPRVALASTGDELVPVDGPALGPGQIRDSNRPMLAAMLTELGVQVIDLGRIPDDASALREAIARGVEAADVLVTSGGV
ncbi:MAG: molybdopterin molybdotransferase MoeA, partial [Acidimicrobiia bacterium]